MYKLLFKVKDEMNQFGDNPWIVRGWGPVMPWSFPADDASDIFEVSSQRLTDAQRQSIKYCFFFLLNIKLYIFPLVTRYNYI